MKWLFLGACVVGAVMLIFGTSGEPAYEDGTAMLVLVLMLLGATLVAGGSIGLLALLFMSL